MPSRTPAERKKHYEEYQSRPDVMRKRAMMNKARRMLEREGKVKKGDGKDVNHIKPLDKGGTSARSNLKVTSRAAYRGYRRNSKNEPV